MHPYKLKKNSFYFECEYTNLCNIIYISILQILTKVNTLCNIQIIYYANRS